jgi:copper type II ascorbate-dependent monooxygenase-like protein
MTAFLALAACSGGPSTTNPLIGPTGGQTQAGPTYLADVKPLIDGHCTGCHFEGGIGPFSLTSYALASNAKASIKAAVEARRMPPYPADPSCNTYRDHIPLSNAEIETISRWVDLGAPEGDPMTATNAAPSALPSLAHVDRTIGMRAPYTPQPAPGELDEYRCFILDWPEISDVYIAGYEVHPGNMRVVHHAIGTVIPPESVPTLLAQHPTGSSEGYACGVGSLGMTGGVGGDESSGGHGLGGGDGAGGGAGSGGGDGSGGGGDGGGGASGGTIFERLQGQGMFAIWAPGLGANVFPDGTGLLIRGGSKIVLQIHYNVATAGPDPDQTKIDLELVPSVSKRAVMMFWTDPRWISQGTMRIPAGARSVPFSFQFDPTIALSGGRPMTIYASGLHMHQLGVNARLWVTGPASKNECLIDIPRWSFHWQRSYELATPAVVKLGDQLAIKCEFDNSAENQPVVGGVPQIPKEVTWGERTGDEMCLGFMYMTL